MQSNRLHKNYGKHFKDTFKSITFDNRNKFTRRKDIEYKSDSMKKRTTLYFASPYHSCDRVSNKNCIGLVCYFIKKDTNINTKTTIDINKKTNNKKGKY